MKKTIFAAALALAATASFAQVTTAFVKYDYDRAEDGVWLSGHRGVMGAAYKLPQQFGFVDAGIVVNQIVTDERETGGGVEIGYSNGVKIESVTLTGRVAYQAATDLKTWRASVEAAVPLAPGIGAFAGYEYLDTKFRDDPQQGDRFTIGADLAINKQYSVRVGYAYMSAEGRSSNGLTTALSYKF
jgi:hypothetical protein